MPIYEYICQKCNSHAELLVRSSSHRPQCPSCGSKALSRQFSTFAAHQGQAASPCQSAGCPAAVGGGCASAGGCPMSR